MTATGVATVRGTVATDRAALQPHATAWDGLADACSRPFCTFDWLLGWWEHAAPAGASLAVVLVHEDDELIGVAPGFLERGRIVRWRPLAAQTCQRVEPFAAPGRERDVAKAIGAALAPLRPDVLSFEGVFEFSPWPGLLAGAWPTARTPRLLGVGAVTSLVLDLPEADFAAWMAAKRRHFRKRLTRSRRAAEEAGGAFRLATPETADADIAAFIRLHVGRWADRGGSAAVPPPVAAFLRATGPALVESGRLRIWSFDLAGETVASGLVLVAGEQVGYWLSGMDEAHAELEPSKLGMLQVIEDAFALGATRLDIGEGDFPYKRRFTSQAEALVKVAVVLPGKRMPLTLAALSPVLAKTWLSEHLDEERKDKVRALRDRITP